MDILSHGLWATLAAKGANLKLKNDKRIKLGWAFFWGVFPDLFAFTIPFVWILGGRILGFSVPVFPHPEDSGTVSPNAPGPLLLSWRLYNISHSLIIFVLTIAFIIGIKKLQNKNTPFLGLLPLSMGGWLLHILMDIPTHSYNFFPTPFLWPIANLKINGYPWNHFWFLAADYGLILVIFLYLKSRDKLHKSQN